MRDTIIPGGGRLDPATNEAKAAGALVQALYEAVEHGRNQISCVPGLLRQVLEEGAWRQYAPPHSSVVHTYPSFHAFAEDWLELTPEELKATCEFAMGIRNRRTRPRDPETDREALALLAEATAQKPTVGALGGDDR